MKIFHVAQYGAPYEGNFIKSLIALERLLVSDGHEVIFAFINKARLYDWCRDFEQSHKVFYLNDKGGRESYEELSNILAKEHPDIIHTHFDGFDIPVIKANRGNSKVIWHLHNPLSLLPDILRNIYMRLCFFRHYGFYSNQVKAIAVSNDVKKFVIKYGFKKESIFTLYNGIDLSRFNRSISKNNQRKDIVNFLAFGGRSNVKGVDLILNAGISLAKITDRFHITITKGVDTDEFVRRFFKNKIPKWLKLVEQQENINILFKEADIFISASRAETFSYAIAEAAYFGIPIISSDIPGVEWSKRLKTISYFKNNSAKDLEILMNRYINGNFCTEGDIEKSIQIVKSEFSIENWAKNIYSIYTSVL